jgi:hypothetical protein
VAAPAAACRGPLWQRSGGNASSNVALALAPSNRPCTLLDPEPSPTEAKDPSGWIHAGSKNGCWLVTQVGRKNGGSGMLGTSTDASKSVTTPPPTTAKSPFVPNGPVISQRPLATGRYGTQRTRARSPAPSRLPGHSSCPNVPRTTPLVWPSRPSSMDASGSKRFGFGIRPRASSFHAKDTSPGMSSVLAIWLVVPQIATSFAM